MNKSHTFGRMKLSDLGISFLEILIGSAIIAIADLSPSTHEQKNQTSQPALPDRMPRVSGKESNDLAHADQYRGEHLRLWYHQK